MHEAKRQLLNSHGIYTPEQLETFLAVLPEEQRREFEAALLEDDPDELEAAKQKALKGDCADLIQLQWPGVVLDGFQLGIINSMMNPDHSQTRIKGCTKPGKGFAVSLGVNLWYYLHTSCKIVLSGPNFRHVLKNLFSEIAENRKKMIYPGPGEVRAESFYDPENANHYLVIANPESGEGFSGQHGPATLFVFDEASSVPTVYYENCLKQARHVVALSNPRTLHGWFRDGYPPNDPDTDQVIATPDGLIALFTIGGSNCLNVKEKRLEKAIGPAGGITIGDRHFKMGERIPPQYFEKCKLLIPNQLDYGRYMGIMQHPDPQHRAVYGEGKFPVEDATKQVILASWLHAHVEFWKQQQSNLPVECFGLDIAASEDGDESFLAVGSSEGCAKLYGKQVKDTTTIVKWVLESAEKHGIILTQGKNPVTVDAIGVGKGVCDQLREKGCWVIEFKGNAVSEDPRRYGNMRAEAYGELGRRLDPMGPDGEDKFAIPNDPLLHEELTAPERIYKAGDLDRFFITPKDRQGPKKENAEPTIREKLGRSPDRADALVYMHYASRLMGRSTVPKLNRPIVVDLEAMKAGAELPEELLKSLRMDGEHYLPDYLRREKPETDTDGPKVLTLTSKDGKLVPKMVPAHVTPRGVVPLPESLFDRDEL